MDPNTQPDVPATAPPMTPPQASTGSFPTVDAIDPGQTPVVSKRSLDGSGMRRTVLAAAVSALLLVGGAVAVVSAASPEPSTSTAPSAPDGATDGATPSTRPDRAGGARADCPNDDGGTSGSGGSATPDESASPDTTVDPSPAATPLT